MILCIKINGVLQFRSGEPLFEGIKPNPLEANLLEQVDIEPKTINLVK